MAWEWVGPVSTAVTGIAGIAGTWLNGRTAGDNQLKLAGEARRHETTQELRKEKREFYGLYLGTLDALDRASSDGGGDNVVTVDTILERLGMSHDDAYGGDWEPGSPPAAVSEEMTEEEVAAMMVGLDRFIEAFKEHDAAFQNIRLCGSARVVAAVDAARADHLKVWELIASGKSWRYMIPSLREELLAAMREDLGYQLEPEED
jgi:hypothetical protein